MNEMCAFYFTPTSRTATLHTKCSAALMYSFPPEGPERSVGGDACAPRNIFIRKNSADAWNGGNGGRVEEAQEAERGAGEWMETKSM